tara:strand:- start:151 stop:564 length:414 start_codon:yes stop_codon:yes gene_type:complete
MKDLLIGLVTLTVILGIVWVSQQENTTDKLISKNNPIEIQDQTTNTINNQTEINFTYTDTIDMLCDLCKNESGESDGMSFSEAFKKCRICLGDDNEFLWRGKLYSTKIKQEREENNLVEKEDTDQISPPNNETVDSE